MIVSQCIVGRWCGPPRSAALEAKWAAFERCADDCHVVFLGTSHIERHIDPRVVDRTLAEQGMQVRSYNLGLPKMSVLEGAELIERLARLRPRRLKLVVMEPTLYLYDADNWSTDRALAEHDWPGTCMAARLTWASETRRGASAWGKLKCVAPHALSFLCRTLGLRRGERLFFALPGSAVVSTPQDAAGFVPLPAIEPPAHGGPMSGGWREKFRRFMQTKPDWSGAGLSPDELAYFDGLIHRIRQIGAEPVFLLGPKVKRDSHTAAVLASQRQRDVALLDHLRGHIDPDIYQIGYWHDFDHLNADGAAIFSRQLALELVPSLTARDARLNTTKNRRLRRRSCRLPRPPCSPPCPAAKCSAYLESPVTRRSWPLAGPPLPDSMWHRCWKSAMKVRWVTAFLFSYR